MSTLSRSSREAAFAGAWSGMARRATSWPTLLLTLWHRRVTIKTLRELDDHTLRDIGLTRGLIEDVVRGKANPDLWLML